MYSPGEKSKALLTMIARKYLAIPEKSVPAEQLFSKADEIVSASKYKTQKLGSDSFPEQKLALFILLFSWLKKVNNSTYTHQGRCTTFPTYVRIDQSMRLLIGQLFKKVIALNEDTKV